MAEQYSYKDAVISHRESSKKFDYFLLGVTLAFLAFSIERFDVLQSYTFKGIIILSWILLLISFLAGLYRQEQINLMLSAETDKFKYEPRYNVFISLKGRPIFDETGKPFSKEEICQETKDLEKAMKILKEQFDKYNKRAIYSYYIQRLCLVSGLISGALFKIINSF